MRLFHSHLLESKDTTDHRRCSEKRVACVCWWGSPLNWPPELHSRAWMGSGWVRKLLQALQSVVAWEWVLSRWVDTNRLTTLEDKVAAATALDTSELGRAQTQQRTSDRQSVGCHGLRAMPCGRDKSDSTGELVGLSGALTLPAIGWELEEDHPDLLQNLKLGRWEVLQEDTEFEVWWL